MKLIMVKEHHSPFPNPIRLKKGELVHIEEKETEFKGWVWTITKSGEQGWTPEQFLVKGRDGKTAVVKRDYDSCELSVSAGDILTVLQEINEWYRACKENSETGWVPVRKTVVLNNKK